MGIARQLANSDSWVSREEMTDRVGKAGITKAKEELNKDKARRPISDTLIEQTVVSGLQEGIPSSEAITGEPSAPPDFLALQKTCPPVAAALEEFQEYVKKAKSEISRESDDARLLGIDKVAEFLDVSVDTVHRKIKAGTLEVRYQGRRPYVTLKELKRHINALPRKPRKKSRKKDY